VARICPRDAAAMQGTLTTHADREASLGGGTGMFFTFFHYPLVNIQKNYGKSQSLMGKSTINGPFSIAMLKKIYILYNGGIIFIDIS